MQTSIDSLLCKLYGFRGFFCMLFFISKNNQYELLGCQQSYVFSPNGPTGPIRSSSRNVTLLGSLSFPVPMWAVPCATGVLCPQLSTAGLLSASRSLESSSQDRMHWATVLLRAEQCSAVQSVCAISSKVTAILLNGSILPTGWAALGRVCVTKS